LEKKFFGHPVGLSTLFFTEMWERFSYYGMRALLLLYMVSAVGDGGMGLDEKTSGAIYGLYTMMVYLLALPGGWIADNVLGLRKSVFYGGCIIALGHFLLLFTIKESFFLGLFFIVVGTGMLKPNISSLVGELYSREENARRDAGYSIFFMGINIGAFLAPFITGYFGEKIDWHYGFAIAGIGMVLGVIQFRLSEHRLGDAGSVPVKTQEAQRRNRLLLLLVTIAVTLIVIFLVSGIIVANPVVIANISAYVIAGSTLLYFGFLLFVAKLERSERNGVIAIAAFFVASVIFYMGYEQAGSSLNLFALRYTDMTLGDFEMPASWLQAVPAVSVLIFTPFFAWLWVRLSKQNLNPPTAIKLSMGLVFVAASYLLMCGAALVVADGQKALPTWLIMTYVLQTFGEICLYPVGLSAVKKLAPRQFSAQLMGVWFMSLALGNLLAGLVAGEMDAVRIAEEPNLMVNLFLRTAIIVLIAAISIFALNKFLTRLTVKI
jgi:POT family proton-dependent oligopeptide transporter